MWYFEAKFTNLDNGKKERVSIEVDTLGLDVSEDEVWCIAVREALKQPMPLILDGVDFLSC